MKKLLKYLKLNLITFTVINNDRFHLPTNQCIHRDEMKKIIDIAIKEDFTISIHDGFLIIRKYKL